MSQSSLATVHIWTNHIGYNPDGSHGRGGKKIDKIFVHHMAGILTAEQCGNVFKTRPASAHYGVDKNARVGQYVKEEDTAWHCGNKAYNQRSIGIELSNDGGASTNWHVSDKVIAKAIDLIVDICKRNGIKKLNYTGDLSGNLCMHKWVASTACPGGYLAGKFKYIAEQVNKKLAVKPTPASELYRVRKTWADAKSQIGAYKVLANAKKECDKHASYSVFDSTGKAVYTNKKTESVQEKICAWAQKTSDSGQYKYKVFTDDVKTHQCPICHNLTGAYKGWNCIGFAWACWHHGGGLPCKCNCEVINDATGEKIYSAKTDAEALKLVQSKCGLSDIKVIRNKKYIPQSELQAGDILLYFEGSKYTHMMLYVGNGKIADSSRGHTPQIKYGVPIRQNEVKVAIRYIGKSPSEKKGYQGTFPALRLKKSNAKVIADTIEWAQMIAKNNNFHYGHGKHAHHNGCYYCGTQKLKKGHGIKMWETTYCCNPFVGAAFSHGGCVPDLLALCQSGDSLDFGTGKGSYEKSKLFTKVALKSIKKGDVLCSDSHVALYIGDGKVIQASGGDDNVVGSKSWNNSIAVGTWSGYKRAYRFNGSVDQDMVILRGEYSDRIKDLQKFLNWYSNYKLTISGFYNVPTLTAVKDFQKKEGLTVDGIVGAKTIEAMKKVKK